MDRKERLFEQACAETAECFRDDRPEFRTFVKILTDFVWARYRMLVALERTQKNTPTEAIPDVEGLPINASGPDGILRLLFVNAIARDVKGFQEWVLQQAGLEAIAPEALRQCGIDAGGGVLLDPRFYKYIANPKNLIFHRLVYYARKARNWFTPNGEDWFAPEDEEIFYQQFIKVLEAYKAVDLDLLMRVLREKTSDRVHYIPSELYDILSIYKNIPY